jgi:hypothetical protein
MFWEEVYTPASVPSPGLFEITQFFCNIETEKITLVTQTSDLGGKGQDHSLVLECIDIKILNWANVFWCVRSKIVNGEKI